MNPFQTVSLQRQRRKKWGACGERMDGGAEIVKETGQRELESAGGAAGLRLGLEDLNVHAALRQGDGGGEPVRSRADDAGPALRRPRIHDGPVRTDWDALKRAPTTLAANGTSLIGAVIVVEEARVAIRWL